jgi:signal transduction histidine kinase
MELHAHSIDVETSLRAKLRWAEAEIEQMKVGMEDMLGESGRLYTETLRLQAEVDYFRQKYLASDSTARRLQAELLPRDIAAAIPRQERGTEVLEALGAQLRETRRQLHEALQGVERRAAEKAHWLNQASIREHELRLDLALRHARACRWDWNPDTDELLIGGGDPEIRSLFGASPPTSASQWQERVHASDRQLLKESLQDCRSEGDGIDVQFRVRPTGRALHWLAMRGGLVQRVDGSRWVIGLVTDVTGMKLAETVLAQANANLSRQAAEHSSETQKAQAQLQQKQKIEALGMIASGVAHDFNNLLSVIGNNAYLLSCTEDSQQRSSLVAQIMKATDRGGQLTSRLLSFGKPGAQLVEQFNLVDEESELRDLLGKSLRPNLQFTLAIEPALWSICVDRNELHLALLNLCINARDAMPDGGRIELWARNRELGPADVRGLEIEAGDYVEIQMHDSGCGIAPEIAERIFEPFFTTKEKGQGTGLGLPQVIAFARNSGGTVLLHSQPDRGSVFSILLPASMQAALPEESSCLTR